MKFFVASKLSEHIAETPEGYLVCSDVAIARTGEMTYGEGETPLEVGEDHKVIVSRTAEDIFRPETMASFEGKAVTILHPDDFVSPDNWSRLAKGVIQNVRRGSGEQENDLVADLLITDSAAINLVKGGLREVSCGYEAEYIQSGVGRGFQKNIIGNHIALVREGRAGSSYAINDHKGKGSKMTVKEKIKSIFSKAQDEALKAADEANMETPETKTGFVSMDDFNKGMKALGDRMDAMSKPDASQPAKASEDAEGEGSGLEARLAKLEAALSKLMESKAGDEAEEGEEVDDEDMEESDDAACKDEEGGEGYTGDSAADTDSRVEILAPGMKFGKKDVKAKALAAAYATKDGKSVINQFTGGKAPNFKDSAMVDSLFVGASEILKMKRNSELAGTRTHDFKSNMGEPSGTMTAEKMNELNAKHYGQK